MSEGSIPPGDSAPFRRAAAGDEQRPSGWSTELGRTHTQGSAGRSGGPAPLRSTPTAFGPYRVVRPLAQGAMGAVYEVIHGDGVHYALKAPHPFSEREELERFRREALSLARLDHPHVVRIHNAHLEGDPPYLVQDLLSGGSLQERLRTGPLPVEEAVTIATKLAHGLASAHAKGLLHRDIKPSNVMFDDRGEPRLADFGLVRALGDTTALTATGQIVGTPAFMAPEQAMGEAVDERTDVYSLGLLLYTMLRGQPPFDGSVHEVLDKLVTKPPPPLRSERPDVPPGIERVCAQAMAKHPDDRFPTATALAGALEIGDCEGAPRQLPKHALLVGGALGVVALAVAVAAVVPMKPADEAPPELEMLEAPSPEAIVWVDAVDLVGVARDDSRQLTLRVGEEEPRAIQSGERFRARASLEPDQTRLELTISDGAGNEVRREWALRRPPLWYTSLPPERRAPGPLPAGLRFGGEPGEYVNAADGSVLVWVPAARFTQRTRESQREVQITRGYFVGKYEVSWAKFRRFCDQTKRPAPSNEIKLDTKRSKRSQLAPDDHPVFNISWDDAKAYCDWAGLRLPSEAEWMLAAVGPGSSRFPWGDENPNATRLNMADAAAKDLFHASAQTPWDDAHVTTAPVSAFPASASPFGCLNMVGNVAEWCADWRAPLDPLERVDPRGPSSGEHRVIKGGSYADGLWACRPGSRSGWHTQGDRVGFRVARSAASD